MVKINYLINFCARLFSIMIFVQGVKVSSTNSIQENGGDAHRGLCPPAKQIRGL